MDQQAQQMQDAIDRVVKGMILAKVTEEFCKKPLPEGMEGTGESLMTKTQAYEFLGVVLEEFIAEVLKQSTELSKMQHRFVQITNEDHKARMILALQRRFESLSPYARHHETCAASVPGVAPAACACGLSKLLGEVEGE